MKKLLKILAGVLAFISAGLSVLHVYRVRSTSGAALSGPKILAGALSPVLALFGAIAAGLGALLGAPLALLGGILGVTLSGRYVARASAPHDGFQKAFGPAWEQRIPAAFRARLLPRRWVGVLPQVPEPRWQCDVPFWTIPGADRQLLCDVWQPPEGVPASGLAFIYLHGSGWHFIDKDVGTRPLFRHLAAQGHVVMDVAYRLCPEVNWQQMAGDPRRAVAWMKTHAAKYGVDPTRIVLAGGSAGGHLALLTAFAPDHTVLTPADVQGMDLSVCGVVSWYGPSDMRVYYTYAGIPFAMPVGESNQDAGSRFADWITGAMGFEMKPPASWRPEQSVQEAMMHGLLGGSPDEAPEAYHLFSPVAHVGSHCPPTLLLQGEHDMIVSAEAVCDLADKLRAAGVPVVHVEYPQTEHAFDLILPQISPPAQAALYEAERFLALLAVR
jgi:acetyl esterase/lipase